MPPRTRFASLGRFSLSTHTHTHTHPHTHTQYTHPPTGKRYSDVYPRCVRVHMCVHALVVWNFTMCALISAIRMRPGIGGPTPGHCVSPRVFPEGLRIIHARTHTHHQDNTLTGTHAVLPLSRLLHLLIGLITPRTSIALSVTPPPPRRVFSESVTHLPLASLCLNNCGKSEHPLAR